MKRIICLISIFVFLAVICPCVNAEYAGCEEFEQKLESELYDSLDEDTKGLMYEEDLKVGDPERITGLKIKDIFIQLWVMLKDELNKPFCILGRLFAVTVIYAAVGNMYDNSTETGCSFSTVCKLAMIVICSDIFTGCIEGLQSSLEMINAFMISYIPLYAAVTTAGGFPVTAGVYSSATVLLCECVELISSKLLIPFIGAISALIIVSSVNPGSNCPGLAESIKKLTTRLLAVLMIIFTGILSLQGHVSSSADALSAKTLRFAATSFIPVIGASVSDAFSAAKGSVRVIGSTFGTIGILLIVYMAARPLLYILAIRIVLWCTQALNDIMGLCDISKMFRELDSVLSVGMSILIAAASAFVISTGAVMSSVTGGG